VQERLRDDLRGPTYEAHSARVRAEAPPGRLVEWHPGDGWGPLCAALGLAGPSEPFQHLNSASELQAMTVLDPAAKSAEGRGSS